MIRFFLLLGASTLFTLGGVAWIASIGLVIYKIYLYINRDELIVWHAFDFIPDSFRDFSVRLLGKFSYLILDLDIAALLVLVGTVFIGLAILLDIAVKRFFKTRPRATFERRSHHDRRIKDRRQETDPKMDDFKKQIEEQMAIIQDIARATGLSPLVVETAFLVIIIMIILILVVFVGAIFRIRKEMVRFNKGINYITQLLARRYDFKPDEW